LRDEVEVESVKRRSQAHARRSYGGLAAGVTGSDDDYVVLFGEGHADSAAASSDPALTLRLAQGQTGTIAILLKRRARRA
jgi:hypothetical protein